MSTVAAPSRHPALRRPPASRARPEPDSVAARILVVLTAGYVLGPRLVQSVTAPKHRAGVGSENLPSSAAASLTGTALFCVLVLFCLLVLLTHIGRLPSDGHGRLVVALSPWVLIVLRDLAADSSPQRAALLYPLLLLTVWVLRPRMADLSVLAYLVGALAGLAMAMGALAPSLGLYRSAAGELVQPEKLLVPWGVLVGPVTNGNNLGQLLSLGLPAVLLVSAHGRGGGRRRVVAVGFTALTLLALLWTASRSSMLAAVGALVTAAVLTLLVPRLRPAAATAAMIVTTSAVVALPLITSGPTTFSNRGQIWALSLASVETSPLVGHGSGYYGEVGRLVNPLPSTAYHGHNEFVQIVVTGGVAFLAVIGLLVVVTGVRAIQQLRTDGPFGVAFLTALAVSCTLEVSFGVVDRGFLLAVTVLPLGWILFARPGPGRRT